MPSLFSSLRQELQGTGYAARSKEARDWFVERVKELNGRINRNKLLRDTEVKQQNLPKWGFMYMFLYDAKHKETLPYFDRFPLVIMLAPAPGGFLGMNLHYLHPRIRAIFLDRLLETISDDTLTERTRLRVRYELLNRARKMRYFAPCLKHYLFEQMKSRPAQIMAPDWETAIFLPTEHFKGAQKTVVWRDSKSIYQKA